MKIPTVLLTRILPIALSAVAAQSLHADTIASYDFSVLNGSRSAWTFGASTSNTIWSGAPWASASGAYLLSGSNEATTSTGVNLGNLQGTSGLLYATAYSGDAVAGGDLNLYSWITGSNAGSAYVKDWIYFEFGAADGYQVALSGVTLSGWRNGVGAPDTLSFDYSLDGGSNWLSYGVDYAVTDAKGPAAIDSYAFTQQLLIEANESILLRFAPFRTTEGTSTGNWHITGLSLSGDVSAVPEPATYAVLLGGVIAGIALIRRYRMAV